MTIYAFSNLRAEQARKGWTDADVANQIGMRGNTFYQKKKRGNFKTTECLKLCKLFGCSFEYLFEAGKE